jgi:hypothetical protein
VITIVREVGPIKLPTLGSTGRTIDDPGG